MSHDVVQNPGTGTFVWRSRGAGFPRESRRGTLGVSVSSGSRQPRVSRPDRPRVTLGRLLGCSVSSLRHEAVVRAVGAGAVAPCRGLLLVPGGQSPGGQPGPSDPRGPMARVSTPGPGLISASQAGGAQGVSRQARPPYGTVSALGWAPWGTKLVFAPQRCAFESPCRLPRPHPEPSLPSL